MLSSPVGKRVCDEGGVSSVLQDSDLCAVWAVSAVRTEGVQSLRAGALRGCLHAGSWSGVALSAARWWTRERRHPRSKEQMFSDEK